MYCTGGIRCEKASAYLLHRGFANVFHLEGGIIHYANTVKEKGLVNKFKGKNFVFDDRLGERISEEIIARCHQCGRPADTHTNCRNEALPPAIHPVCRMRIPPLRRLLQRRPARPTHLPSGGTAAGAP